MSHRKPLIRRTFSQERYEILIKRQRNGKATFNELTELDEIVNRDPDIRKIVLIENNFIPGADENDTPEPPSAKLAEQMHRHNWLIRAKLFLERIFMLPVVAQPATPNTAMQ